MAIFARFKASVDSTVSSSAFKKTAFVAAILAAVAVLPAIVQPVAVAVKTLESTSLTWIVNLIKCLFGV